MSTIGNPERATQDRVIALFRDELNYRYFGDWSERGANNNIEESLLSGYLTRSGYTPAQVSRALDKLRIEAPEVICLHNKMILQVRPETSTERKEAILEGWYREQLHRTGSIRLITELAKKRPECMKYVVVHEMAHLLEPSRNRRFLSLLDQFMPKWHEFWEY